MWGEKGRHSGEAGCGMMSSRPLRVAGTAGLKTAPVETMVGIRMKGRSLLTATNLAAFVLHDVVNSLGQKTEPVRSSGMLLIAE